jgi:hypothetical protein
VGADQSGKIVKGWSELDEWIRILSSPIASSTRTTFSPAGSIEPGVRRRPSRGKGHHGNVDRRRSCAKIPIKSASLLTRGAGGLDWAKSETGKRLRGTIGSAGAFLYAASVMLLVRRIARAS